MAKKYGKGDFASSPPFPPLSIFASLEKSPLIFPGNERYVTAVLF